MNKLAEDLSKIIETPVSPEILKLVTEKQINLLKMMVENITDPHPNNFYYRDKEASLKVIYSILNYGKQKLPKKVYSDKTKNYLETKLK